MARRSPDEAILTAVVAHLDAQTTSDTYTEVPQSTAAPYVKVTLVTGRREDTCGRFGAVTLIDADAVTAGPSQQLGTRMRNAVIQALNNLTQQTLALSGHALLGTAWDLNEYFPEVVNGVKHHHHVASVRLWTEQSTS